MDFQIHALPAERFQHLFDLDDQELAKIGAMRRTVTDYPGTPCRVSLADARPGETVLLLNYEHLPELSPFRASHAIYVRKDAPMARPAKGEVPDVLASRLLSVRGFDADHLMEDADVVDGTRLAARLRTMLDDGRIAYIHVHFAKYGCFAARVTRG
ncbi:MAG: DUF1203 domain-containing protein [Paracoccaceae bacterium]